MIKKIKIHSEDDKHYTLSDENMNLDLVSIIAKLENCATHYSLKIDIVRNDIAEGNDPHIKFVKHLLGQLTKRELEILHLALQRLPNKEISEKLCISLETVKTHRKRIVSKAGVKNVNDLKDILFNIDSDKEFELMLNHSVG